jgi:hypothetical protein
MKQLSSNCVTHKYEIRLKRLAMFKQNDIYKEDCNLLIWSHTEVTGVTHKY